MATVTYWIAFKLNDDATFGGLGRFDTHNDTQHAIRLPTKKEVLDRCEFWSLEHHAIPSRYTEPVEITIDIREHTSPAAMLCYVNGYSVAHHAEWMAHMDQVNAYLKAQKERTMRGTLTPKVSA